VTEPHPLVERYLARLDAALANLPAPDRREVLQEIRNHIAEAVTAGKPLDAVLQSLGSADDLARAYAVELLLHPRATTSTRADSGLNRFLKVLGLIAIGSIPTLVIVVTLVAIGVSFLASGVVVFIAGVMGVSGNLPYWVEMDNVDPVLAIIAGPALAVLGAAAIAGLVWYVKFAARTVRAVLPK
jgi:uncharacterized membrane protein